MPALTRHFLQQSAKQLGVEPKRISDAALAQLATFGFPGNVRQLENICHWLTVMAPAQLIEPKDLPPEVMAACRAEPVRGRAPARRSSATPAPAVSGRSTTRPSPAAAVRQSPAPARPVAGLGERASKRKRQSLLAAAATTCGTRCRGASNRSLILTALANTRGRRIEAAQKLGIGRNTITRKIQELGLE